jgi:small subunit ribosomal protein S6
LEKQRCVKSAERDAERKSQKLPLLPRVRQDAGELHRPEEAGIEIYEAMLIAIPELDEDQVGNTLGRFQTVIERTGGEVRDVNQWGRRRLAYEIDNRRDGFYSVMEFTAGERTLPELKRILRVSDDVLRYVIVRLPHDYASGNRPETKSEISSSAEVSREEGPETEDGGPTRASVQPEPVETAEPAEPIENL